MNYHITEYDRKVMESKGLSEAEYWYRRAKDAEYEVRRLERICDSQEREINRLQAEDYDYD